MSPDLNIKLEAAARDEKLSVGSLRERIAREWLSEHRLSDEEEAEQQRRLRERSRSTNCPPSKR